MDCGLRAWVTSIFGIHGTLECTVKDDISFLFWGGRHYQTGCDCDCVDYVRLCVEREREREREREWTMCELCEAIPHNKDKALFSVCV